MQYLKSTTTKISINTKPIDKGIITSGRKNMLTIGGGGGGLGFGNGREGGKGGNGGGGGDGEVGGGDGGGGGGRGEGQGIGELGNGIRGGGKFGGGGFGGKFGGGEFGGKFGNGSKGEGGGKASMRIVTGVTSLCNSTSFIIEELFSNSENKFVEDTFNESSISDNIMLTETESCKRLLLVVFDRLKLKIRIFKIPSILFFKSFRFNSFMLLTVNFKMNSKASMYCPPGFAGIGGELGGRGRDGGSNGGFTGG